MTKSRDVKLQWLKTQLQPGLECTGPRTPGKVAEHFQNSKESERDQFSIPRSLDLSYGSPRAFFFIQASPLKHPKSEVSCRKKLTSSMDESELLLRVPPSSSPCRGRRLDRSQQTSHLTPPSSSRPPLRQFDSLASLPGACASIVLQKPPCLKP